MTTAAVFGLEMPGGDVIGQWVLRLLAVAGGAAVGGLVIGLITQGLARLLTTRPVPRMPLNIIRLLGAIVCGWIVALLLFGGGLGGLGSGSGWSLFGGAGGPGGGSGKEPPPATTGREGGTGRDSGPRDTSKTPPTEGMTLDIEVLPERDAYRVSRPGGGSERFDFQGLTDYLLKQQKATPPLTGVRISPGKSDPDAPAVRSIITWAEKHGLYAGTPPNQSP
jgi:hypothetical protein